MTYTQFNGIGYTYRIRACLFPPIPRDPDYHTRFSFACYVYPSWTFRSKIPILRPLSYGFRYLSSIRSRKMLVLLASTTWWHLFYVVSWSLWFHGGTVPPYLSNPTPRYWIPHQCPAVTVTPGMHARMWWQMQVMLPMRRLSCWWWYRRWKFSNH